VDTQIELESLLVLEDEVALDGHIFWVVGVDDRKLAPLEDCTCSSVNFVG
jgi:hypothetical protein